MEKFLFCFILVALAFQMPSLAGEKTPDEEAVYQTILDYVEGIYNGEPDRIRRSVHPQMRKHGFYKKEGKYIDIPMTFERLVKLASSMKEKGQIPPNPPKQIVLFEVADQTASAKLIAFWGMDYFHLAKFEGKWMISNVIWQSLPEDK